jgi:hypothetical protein
MTAGSPESRTWAGNVGAIEVLVTALHRHPGKTLEAHVSGALCNIANENDVNKTNAGIVGAVELVVKVMQRLADDTEVQERACDALYTMRGDNEENKGRAGMAGAVEAVVATMWRHNGSAAVHERGCAALYALVNYKTENQIKAENAGAFEAVVTALRKYTSIEKLQSQALLVMRFMTGSNAKCRRAGARALQAENTCPFVPIDVQLQVQLAMRRHADSNVLQSQACGVLRNLAGLYASYMHQHQAEEHGCHQGWCAGDAPTH